MNSDEHIFDIECGALFTLALSNRGRIFVAGLIGGSGGTSIEEQTERTKFRVVDMPCRIERISAGLSGAGLISTDECAYFWGRFGKVLINSPKKIER